jgi:tol-pal system protein YbgF
MICMPSARQLSSSTVLWGRYLKSIGTIYRTAMVATVFVFVSMCCAHAGQSPATVSPSQQMAQMSAPPGDVPGEPTNEGEAATLVLRIDRLENELRQANGAIEQLQNQQRRLEDQLKRFQEDIEFRLNGTHGPSPAPDSAGPVKSMKKSDAFDPVSDPTAAGAPRPIGTTPPSAPLARTPAPVGAPLDLSHGGATAPAPAAGDTAPSIVASVGPTSDGPREEFNAAVESYRQGQYEQAEQQLRSFVAKNAGNRLVPDAVFYIGETFFQRSRPREAAEQYLKVSTDYAKSSRAPEGLLRLGQSLAALGSADQACATFAEVARRYPTAASSVRKNAEREMQKDHC